MSQFTPALDRDGIDWGKPVGTWKQGQDVIHLETFAEKLTIPEESISTDLLNSIPTPWSRLLMFESALFNAHHPSHQEILGQWRGLLGLLALARPLKINLEPSNDDMTVDLGVFDKAIAKTFTDLRPKYLVRNESNVVDREKDKWNKFHLISVGDHILGATSPRTLVFTGVSHRCPATIPFCSDAGRLEDPTKYFKEFNDSKYLTLLKQWVDRFVSNLSNDDELRDWLGTLPAPPNVAAQLRRDKLLGLLRNWQSDINQLAFPNRDIGEIGQFSSFFTLPHYSKLQFLPDFPVPGEHQESDLLLNTKKTRDKKVVVCYRPTRSQNPKRNSMLYNEMGQLIQSDSLLIWNGRWAKADTELPEKIDYLPSNWEVIDDPVENLFEDKLIEAGLPDDEGAEIAVHKLTVTGKGIEKTFLYPFKKRILNYFQAEEIHRYTRIELIPDRGYLVTLTLPLHNGRQIRATRIFEMAEREFVILTNNPLTDHRTSELAMWPHFRSNDWNYYYYFKRILDPQNLEREIDFKPVSDEISEPEPGENPKRHWYTANQPVEAFSGHLGKHCGLLLPIYTELGTDGMVNWKVAVDFGSTHTRAFYLPVGGTADEGYTVAEDARIEPLEFTILARQLTRLNPVMLEKDFFALDGVLDPPTRTELKTLLMKPVDARGGNGNWLPRDGFGYLHWIYSGFDRKKLKSDIKWEGNGKGDLRAYLRWLMVQIEAEAMLKKASIVEVLRSFPTAFNETLKAHHANEWVLLGDEMNFVVDVAPEREVSEAIATARYLVDKKGGEAAPLITNTISLDVGGSTTDIAIWYGKSEGAGIEAILGAQESIKMAAGIVAKYLQTSPQAHEFLTVFAKAVQEQSGIELSFGDDQKNNFGLLFFNMISVYEYGDDKTRKKLDTLIRIITTSPEFRGLLAHIIFLFGGIIYYSGLLTRQVRTQRPEIKIYYLYFCGKGGSLIKWIDKHEVLATKLFVAGLFGPESKVPQKEQDQVKVSVKVSKLPKQEVGRGLLAKLRYRFDEEDSSFGLYDLKAPSVTVGETNYSTVKDGKPILLEPMGDLDAATLRDLDSKLPAFSKMKELNHFIKALKEAYSAQDPTAPVFDFDDLLNNSDTQAAFADKLLMRFFGEDSIVEKLRNENDVGALTEPILITEMKVLLEQLSKNEELFQ